MGSESKNRNGDGEGAAAQDIPATAKKVVQSFKEIVNCTDQEIYAALKECDMDPDRAVERLLTQDTFHEVRSKRERRKEMKETLDSRSRGNNAGLSHGGKTGSDRKVRSGLTHVTYNELGKATDMGEVGSACPSVPSSITDVVGKSTNSDSFNTDNGRQTLGTDDSISASAQVSSAFQPSWLGVSKGHLSMADIVRMGRPSQDAVSHDHSNASGGSAAGNPVSSLSLDCQNHSEQQVFNDEWPVIEQPITGSSQTLNVSASSNANGPSSEHPSLLDNSVSLHRNCELDEAQVSRGDVASENVVSEKIETASISSKHGIVSSSTGLGPRSNHDLKNTVSSGFHSSYGHHRDKLISDAFVDVSSAASEFHWLSIREAELEVPSSEDNRTLVLPNHIQALAAECSPLSFGTYNGGSNSANPSRSRLEEKAASVDGSSAQFLDTSSPYHQLGFEFDVPRGTTGNQNHDFLSSSRQELVKHIVPEAMLGHETMASVSDPSFQKSRWVTPSSFESQGLQSSNLSTFPKEMLADSNSVPGDVLEFLMSQSQATGYSNALSSISNPAISMSEVVKPGAFALPRRSALPQDLTVQSSMQFEQLPDMKSYLSLPQNQSYLTAVNSQQAFTGNTAYNQSPAYQSSADMKYNLPQNRSELLLSRLPPATARDTFGYGNLGSSSYNPGSFVSNPSLGYAMPSSNFNEILPSQYNGGGRNLSSIQPHGSLSQWHYGAESRPSYLQERMQYNFLGQQPSQAPPSQFVNPGYSDLYLSQTRVAEELQRPGGFQDLSSKQSHQFWQHGH